MLAEKLVGQASAIEAIVPYIQMYQAGLSPEGRPVGVFMLLGPTGTGKTRTVEALAEVLHGSAKKMLKVDCGEFQMEHEVAKLVGAPPGYLGHRETQPMLNQQKLNAAASETSDLVILLFDEIEKAAPSMARLLLGILDKATLRLGDNNTVNFERALIFLTSNLGARAMQKQLHPDFGFEKFLPATESAVPKRLHKIGLGAVRRKFSPEFVNRIDSVVTYQPLTPASLSEILDQQLRDLQDHIFRRLGIRAFRLDVPTRTRRLLLKMGASEEYGARELKRTIHRTLIQPLAVVLTSGEIQPGARVVADVNEARTKLVIRVQPHPDQQDDD
jgi:ATP-dependent Clp protease ATP-binding subunit ClpA